MQRPEIEYAVKFCRDHWKVYKLDARHGTYIGCYEVRLEDDAVVCNCPAYGWCKHLQMVLDQEENNG